MASNNTGIAHISTKGSRGEPLCGNRSAIVSRDFRVWLSGEDDKWCQRCAPKANKIKALEARKASRIVCE